MDIVYVGHSCYRIETAGMKALVDPWLTDRLDRFWVHHPRQAVDFDPGEITAVFITHHHIDHFHPESLRMLSRDAAVFVPSPEKTPSFAGSGMGFKAMPWTLRSLGFHRVHYLEPFAEVEVGGLAITCLPSKVGFPEVAYLMSGSDGTVVFCGDSLLHPKTGEYLETRRPEIDVAFIPCHSTSPAQPLMQRKPVEDAEQLKTYSRRVFQRNIDRYGARYVVPSAFGVRIDGGERADRFGWANRTLFPFTPDEAASYMRQTNQDGFKFRPGDGVRLRRGAVEPDVGPSEIRIYADMEISEETEVPAFVPGEQGERAAERDLDALMARAGAEVIGTRYWLRGTETGRRAQVRLSNGPGDSASYLFDPAGPDPWQRLDGDDLDEMLPYSWLHSDTLARLLDGDLLMSSSFGLWVSTDNWLTHVFHHPKYYVRNLTRAAA